MAGSANKRFLARLWNAFVIICAFADRKIFQILMVIMLVLGLLKFVSLSVFSVIFG